MYGHDQRIDGQVRNNGGPWTWC